MTLTASLDACRSRPPSQVMKNPWTPGRSGYPFFFTGFCNRLNLEWTALEEQGLRRTGRSVEQRSEGDLHCEGDTASSCCPWIRCRHFWPSISCRRPSSVSATTARVQQEREGKFRALRLIGPWTLISAWIWACMWAHTWPQCGPDDGPLGHTLEVIEPSIQ